MSKTDALKCKFPEECKLLIKMRDKDQQFRNEHSDFSTPELTLELHRIDYENYTELKEILTTIQSPSVENVSEDGAMAVWLVAQHATFDVGFMEEVCGLIEECTRDNPENGYRRGIPYLIDRVRMLKGQKQIYGTQFTGTGGQMKPFPIDNPKRVDELRAEFGLESYEENMKQLQGS